MISLSIFGVNNDLMKQILREAEEDEFAIDDSEFNDPEEIGRAHV